MIFWLNLQQICSKTPRLVVVINPASGECNMPWRVSDTPSPDHSKCTRAGTYRANQAIRWSTQAFSTLFRGWGILGGPTAGGAGYLIR
jgi:hypothetical protein